MSSSLRINPELSIVNQKNEVKRQREQVQTMNNRVQMLRQQLQKEKDNIKKNKQLTKDAIQKKIEVNQMSQWKNRDHQQQIIRVNELRRRNQEVRLTHEKQLQDIQKAVYLVKLDDARELKQQSDEHNRRIRQMERDFLTGQQQKKRRVAEEAQMAKEKYTQFWKDKLTGIYTEQAQNIIKLGKEKEANKKNLSKLQQEELKLMEEINKFHSQSVEAKKEYLAAMSIPVKDVADAMGENHSAIKNNLQSSHLSKKRHSMTINHSQMSNYQQNSKRYAVDIPSNKMPSTNVNQGKLKMVLQQLKKSDRNALHTSR